MIAALAQYVPEFCDALDAKEAELRERYGIAPADAVDLEELCDDWTGIPDTPLTDEEKAARRITVKGKS